MSVASFDRAWLAAHVPQKDGMCLLDAVVAWDAQQAWCRSGSHRRADHPLRAHGRLGSASAIEYAAQAAAVHATLCGALREGAQDRPAASLFGMLASVRAVDLARSQLDDVRGDLLVRVTRMHSDARSALYAFSVSEERADGAAALPLAQGRLSLWLGAPTASVAPEIPVASGG